MIISYHDSVISMLLRLKSLSYISASLSNGKINQVSNVLLLLLSLITIDHLTLERCICNSGGWVFVLCGLKKNFLLLPGLHRWEVSSVLYRSTVLDAGEQGGEVRHDRMSPLASQAPLFHNTRLLHYATAEERSARISKSHTNTTPFSCWMLLCGTQVLIDHRMTYKIFVGL